MALFSRVGGGIYTKAADVGADLVGKVEAGIPEDDPRNPAVIADNVGDNVGDVAGMGADLFESYVGSIVSALLLGYAAFGDTGVTYTLLVASAGMIASAIGIVVVKFIRRSKNNQPVPQYGDLCQRGADHRRVPRAQPGDFRRSEACSSRPLSGILAGPHHRQVHRILHLPPIPPCTEYRLPVRDGSRHQYIERLLGGDALHRGSGGGDRGRCPGFVPHLGDIRHRVGGGGHAGHGGQYHRG